MENKYYKKYLKYKTKYIQLGSNYTPVDNSQNCEFFNYNK